MADQNPSELEEALLSANNKTQEALAQLRDSIDKNERLLLDLENTLFKINHLEGKIAAYQLNADILGTAIALLSLVLAFFAIYFMFKSVREAKEEAREAASKFLGDETNITDIVLGWLEENYSDKILPELILRVEALRDSAIYGDDYANAYASETHSGPRVAGDE